MSVRDLIPRMRTRMPAVRSESANPILSFHKEMNRLFDDFWREFDGGSGSSLTPSFGFPHVEVSESGSEVKVEAELPGMDEKDVELLLDNGILTLRGERRGETEDRSRRISERYYGHFERQIALPADVQEDKVKAEFRKGVLTVILPKSAEADQRVKRIPIN